MEIHKSVGICGIIKLSQYASISIDNDTDNSVGLSVNKSVAIYGFTAILTQLLTELGHTVGI